MPLAPAAAAEISPSLKKEPKTYAVKIPRGLRLLLNDITKEVLENKEAAKLSGGELQVYGFCADILERKAKNQQTDHQAYNHDLNDDPNDEDEEEDEIARLQLKRETTFNLSATDSGNNAQYCKLRLRTLSHLVISSGAVRLMYCIWPQAQSARNQLEYRTLINRCS